MAQNRIDQIGAALERDWPRWHIWVVHRVVGGTLWCARRWDDTGNALNADTPEELVALLEQEASR